MTSNPHILFHFKKLACIIMVVGTWSRHVNTETFEYSSLHASTHTIMFINHLWWVNNYIRVDWFKHGPANSFLSVNQIQSDARESKPRTYLYHFWQGWPNSYFTQETSLRWTYMYMCSNRPWHWLCRVEVPVGGIQQFVRIGQRGWR